MVISIIVVFSLYPFNTNADKINHEIPKGYYQNKQLGYVFHWLRDRSIKSTYFLLLGSFKQATVSYGLRSCPRSMIFDILLCKKRV